MDYECIKDFFRFKKGKIYKFEQSELGFVCVFNDTFYLLPKDTFFNCFKLASKVIVIEEKINLNPNNLEHINKALGIIELEEKKEDVSKENYWSVDHCKGRSDKLYCEWKIYKGFMHDDEYCIHCGNIRNMVKYD